MRPLLTYYGGKQKMVKNLLPLIPRHNTYVEPFCGGASLFFAKEPAKIEILNDIDSELTNFYMVVQKHPKLFEKRLNEYPYSEEIYSHFKKNKTHKNPITRAVGFYIRIMMSFAHKKDGGFGYSPENNQSLLFINKIKNISKAIERLKIAQIMNRDANEIIKLFDREKTLFYCDPPYPDTSQGHYKGYTQGDFKKLIETLSECKGSIILSCYDNDAVPKEWEKYEFKACNSSSNTRSGGHRQERIEVVWRKLSDWAKQKEMEEDPYLMRIG
jgi:DNA adenine methylase